MRFVQDRRSCMCLRRHATGRCIARRNSPLTFRQPASQRYRAIGHPIQPRPRMLSRCSTLASIATCAFGHNFRPIVGVHLCIADEAISKVETNEKQARADTG